MELGIDRDDSTSTIPSVNLIQANDLCKYFLALLPPLVEGSHKPSPQLEAVCTESANGDLFRKFINEPSFKTLVLHRTLSKEDEGDVDPDDTSERAGVVAYSLASDVQYMSSKTPTVAVLKRGIVIEVEKSITSQVRILELTGTPAETLHSYISAALGPYFKSYARRLGKGDSDGDKLVSSVEKKFVELEMSLLHLQQNIDIPEVTLAIHPAVSAILHSCDLEKRRPTTQDYADLAQDSSLLNNLQNGVSKWIRDIQKVTKMDRDPSSGNALQEIAFWSNLERALLRLQEKTRSPAVLLTLEILKCGKRFHAVLSFETDAGLKAAMDLVDDYSTLMKDFPLDELLSATELSRIKPAITVIFTHLRKIRNTKYPVQRVMRLVEAISKDLSSQMLKVLGTRKLLHINFEEFEKMMVSCFEVFSTWDDEYDKFQSLLRDMLKRNREETHKMVGRISPSHRKLQARLEMMRRFRRLHEQLHVVIHRVLSPSAKQIIPEGIPIDISGASASATSSIATSVDSGEGSAVHDINLAYELVKEVEGLDVSPEGSILWDAALKRYDERIDQVESKIAERLRDQLGTARNANEMFRIFSRYNALFVRPHIRGAIQEYQAQLIQRVKADLETLHDKFKGQFSQSIACKLSKLRDIPPVSSYIIWAKQIERQLNTYMRRVEDVLGKGWEGHIEGQKLKAMGDSFRQKLNTQVVFEEWLSQVQQRNLGVSGHIFSLETIRSRSAKENTLRLKVSFIHDVINLAKEVRNLKGLGFRVPIAVMNKAHQANQLYPYAITLTESVRAYQMACEKVEETKSIAPLVAGTKRELHALILEGANLVWESYKLEPYVLKFSEAVTNFQEKVEELLVIAEKIDLEVRVLETCPYTHEAFEGILTKLQKAVDELSLQSYSNLGSWVSSLDQRIEERLANRLVAGIQTWCAVLRGHELEDAEEGTKPGGTPEIKSFKLEVRIQNQVLRVQPPPEAVRQHLCNELQQWICVITSQSRITSALYQSGYDRNLPDTETTYRRLLSCLPDKCALEKVYESIEDVMKVVLCHTDTWLCYQCLWDVQTDMIIAKVDTIERWIELLESIKASRVHIDSTETSMDIGPIRLDYHAVQSKVVMKYDTWQKDLLLKFSSMLLDQMTQFHSTVSKSRGELERQSLEVATTSQAVALITFVQSVKRKLRSWEKTVESFQSGQKILDRQRFQFPPNWLHVENVYGEWTAFNEILRRKDAAIQNQVASLQLKVVSEDQVVEARTAELLSDWEKGRPVSGTARPDHALSTLAVYEGRLVRLKEDRENLQKAKEALELAEPDQTSPSEQRMKVAMEELEDLKGTWTEVSKVWAMIDELKDGPWLSVQPRKLRQSLDNIADVLKNFPIKMKQYASYNHVYTQLRYYQKVNMLVTELKSEALKERHWRSLTKRLGVQWVMSELTLGQLWDVDLNKNESAVKDVLLIAQGEMALEEFLKQVREAWSSYELELTNYQNRCKLIRGWDDLFNKVKEHISSVGAMKLSPYFKVFEEDASQWEDKLNRILTLFDIWIDVQRRWVYLDGIFSGSGDIQHLLPVETQRFSSISSEYVGLMKKVVKSPLVLDVLNIPGVQKSLERLADFLQKIQKALGEYLERERQSFPRFYFVGDEDLLEIIGNSKNITRLQKHFKKMFAGVATLLLNDDHTVVSGVASKEGEELLFLHPVVLTDHPKINDWLSMVEKQMRMTLATRLADAVKELQAITSNARDTVDVVRYHSWLDSYQAQLVVLAAQIVWSERCDTALLSADRSGDDLTPLEAVLSLAESTLVVLADAVLSDQPPVRRRKLENQITELVHQRDVTRLLLKNKVSNQHSFEWLSQMRFYFDPKQKEVLEQLSIHMANAKFHYGFEYLGVQDKLVQTPLTDRCYLAMTQALEARLGGSPFGPAGTGKTESVKALGNQLGRFVLVFNCDETFDFQAMGRIFVGLCQVGAWGCFDEFNRLEERMLSAVSQQIQTIQLALKENTGRADRSQIKIELVGKEVQVRPDMAIFITMNPGYAGRSNLPDNLKKLFRSLAMTKPDRQLIAEVMLYSQGFRTAENLARKIVPFFKLCDEQLSPQSHYDFGLRALKSVLVSAGNVKRDHIARIRQSYEESGQGCTDEQVSEKLNEQEILIQSICDTMVPKLVSDDIPLLHSLLSDVFPGIKYSGAEMRRLHQELQKVCKENHLVYGEGKELGALWVDKVMQLYQIICLNHGVMMVGPSGSGKSRAWKMLLKALGRIESNEGAYYVIDPKAMSKDDLYGLMDPNTREWHDGLFTHILRKIVDNVRGELNRRQWIVFDGDVHPEWVENLNSVLDDNKLLTLPNGERLSIPPNVRILFEVQDLKHATLATVSRCGMVWFSEDVLSVEMIVENYLSQLRAVPLEDDVDGSRISSAGGSSESLMIQRHAADLLFPYLKSDSLMMKALDHASKMDHVMEFTRIRALSSLLLMLNQGVRDIINYNRQHVEMPLTPDQMEAFIQRFLVYSLVWCLTGDGKMKQRIELGDFIRAVTTIPLPATSNQPVIDYEVTISGDWSPWQNKVPIIEVETHKVAAPDVVVPTLDTVRHESLLHTWLAEHKPLVLCGPPGSGKTMTLLSALRSIPDLEVVGLNFSSATTPELVMKTLDHYCEYRRTPNGLVLAPTQIGKWIVLFCDEINLPEPDQYGTIRVITFLRQLVEQGGFYRSSDQMWVSFERIQFVGACNPPTDPGRKPLSHRFLRHVLVVYVDYPGPTSLSQIYGTFNRAMLRLFSNLRSYAQSLTDAMVELYSLCQERFTQDIQPHYVYSPREMTRWVRGILEAIRPQDSLTIEGLVRVWAHEALRLFQDRLMTNEERKWTDDLIDATAKKYFPGIDLKKTLCRPILYSNWLTKDYTSVDREQLKEFMKARLKVFYEEELDVQLVLFDEVFDHVLRIDRVFRQPQGHVLLIGVSGAGKTTLARFAAWMNGLSVFQVKVHRKYSAEDFDEDLRNVLRRSGCRGEKIAFIMDEGNILDSSFLERMNTLLANGEVPGLFEGDEYNTLITQCKEGAQREGLMLDSSDELYKWFTSQIIRNLHVVFTMNPSSEGLKSKAATSPALFNRCVLDWFGDWSTGALYQVGQAFSSKMDLERPNYKPPNYLPLVYEDIPKPPQHRDVVVNAMVFIHQTLHKANESLMKQGKQTISITPRHFLDFISQYANLFNEKRTDLEEQQLHLNVGLNKIKETVAQLEEMQNSLSVKSKDLEAKNALANQKLKQMVHDQQEAEKKKVTGQEIRAQLEAQTKVINERRESVMGQLAMVEPAVNEAKQAVSSIKKQHLVEVRTMGNPPPMVKMAMESICLLIGQPANDWKDIRSIIIKEDFIPGIVNFNTDYLTDDIRNKMVSKYLSNPDYNFEKINRASHACGPLVKWAIAQCYYAEMLQKVDPLRKELQDYEAEQEKNRLKLDAINKLIAELEASITGYREEYAVLISEAQAIKSDLASVEAKVNRSVALLRSLGGERTRWEESRCAFQTQMATVAGDGLLAAAFLAYAGYFDQHMRENLWVTWCDHLQKADIFFQHDLSRTEFLSTADDRMGWLANSLPSDDLCTENAVMLKRFNRYPLIIDPSGQAIDFLVNEYKSKKITKTSFLDDSFRKNLESALRFGHPLLVQDVENYDPIMNPVLNREVRKTSGRVLITLGDQDIDISPTFMIFLSTRDPFIQLPPDLCSRVTLVNFTVTPSSLQSQCLHLVLKAERPDVNAKRSDLLKLQGEFRLRLRHLEKQLLQALNDSKGSLLDDDRVIATLETLKEEAAEVSRKAQETDTVMAEVEQVSSEYQSLAAACSAIYFTLDSLNQVHFLYQYSLQFFMDIFASVLNDTVRPSGEGRNARPRLQALFSRLFQLIYNRVARGMLHEDRVVLAILLCQIHLRGHPNESNYTAEIDHLLRGREVIATNVEPIPGLQMEQVVALHRLTKLPQFKDLASYVRNNSTMFADWLQQLDATVSVPQCWILPSEKPLSLPGQAMNEMLVVQAFRPDQLVTSARKFVIANLGETFMLEAETEIQLSTVVLEVNPHMPVLLCSVPGYDASYLVEDLVSEQSRQCASIAIGSSEGFLQAEKAISLASKTGMWVLLKNVHLAPQWLITLEKRIHSLSPHPEFRLFLTMEINPKVPINLLRASRILIFEPPPGIKANLIRTFSSIPQSRMNAAPAERARTYFLLGWLHAIVQERLRYCPLGWSKVYEFNEADLRVACDMLDTWISTVAHARSNVPPESLPWDALRTLLGQCIYGGRIDNEFDQRLLMSFIGRIFDVRSFDPSYPLVVDVDGVKGNIVKVPTGLRRDEFMQWVNALPDKQSPSWLGLPNNAEKVLLTSIGESMQSKLLKMQGFADDLELAYIPEKTKKTVQEDQRPVWIRTLNLSVKNWLSLFPEKFQPLKRTADNIKDPIFRFFEREVNLGLRLLKTMCGELADIALVCEGKKKQTNALYQLMVDLSKGNIPKSWRIYRVSKQLTVIPWIVDLAERLKQLQQMAVMCNNQGMSHLKKLPVWLGGMFIPEAYLTAMRQFTAQSNSWSLEELALEIKIPDSPETPVVEEPFFVVKGLKLQGAESHQSELSLTSSITSDLPWVVMRWCHVQQLAPIPQDRHVILPLYLDQTRSETLVTLDVCTRSGSPATAFYERGVAFIATNLSG